MKRLFQIAVFLLIATGSISAQSPNREVRATWLTTTWAMDWPTVTVPAANGSNETARANARETQKSGLIAILDKLQAVHFNTVFFQVRGMSDAFYKSKYEPWSQWLSSARGADPGWDPLEFVVAEAHKRGMEVHAWLNPYRYSTAVSSHGNLPTDYATAKPGWLMDYGNWTKILNPGIPEVRQRICDIVDDIISNYDVDGIVFDDYFYANEGSRFELDAAQFKAYNPSNLSSQADWRRENVNQMVRDVQARIKNSTKPYLAFGIGPAGVTCRTQARANKFGIDPCPAGSDWQYDGIYSDPVAWLYNGTIDYISPQVYWSIGSSSDFAKISPWWAKVANKFGKHFFSSNTSHTGGDTKLSRFSTSEMLAQLRLLRASDLNGTPGAVHFRYKSYLSTTYDAFEEQAYQLPALTAIYGWKTAPMQYLVENLAVSGKNLTWTYSNNNVRYAIYAVPNANRNDADAFTSPKYLQGVSYTKSFTLPDKVSASTHKIAIAVYDRYGNLFPPRVFGEALITTLAPAQLKYPANNQANMDIPALFTWNSNGADYYVWQLSENSDFSKTIASRETRNTNFNSALISGIKINTTYYWRVKSIKANAQVAVSEVRTFKAVRADGIKVTSPANGATVSTLTPTISWTAMTNASYTLEISTSLHFDDIVYTKSSQVFSAAIPSGVLKQSTTYHVRVRAEVNGRQFITEPVNFSTTFVQPAPMPVPTIISPVNEANIGGTEIKVTWKEQHSRGFRVELSQDPTFPSRTLKVKETPALTYDTTFEKLDKGTYYIHMMAFIDDGKQTSATGTVKVYLTGLNAIEDINASKFCYNYYDAAGNCYIVINDAASLSATLDIYSITGVLINRLTFPLNTGENTVLLDMTNYAEGIYLIKVNTGNKEKTMKVKK